MEQPSSSGPEPPQPILTIAAVNAEALRFLRTSITSFVPLASAIIVFVTGFLYVVGVHTYDSLLDRLGLPISVIQPSLNQILVRGAEACIPGGFLLLLFAAFLIVLLYLLMAYLGLYVEKRTLRLYHEILANPDTIDARSSIERRIKRALKRRMSLGWTPNTAASVRELGIASPLSSFGIFMLIFAPIFLIIAGLVGYDAPFPERLAGYIKSPNSLTNKFEYMTDKRSVCGSVLIEGVKGIAVGQGSSAGFSLVILHPEDVRQIRQVDACPALPFE